MAAMVTSTNGSSGRPAIRRVSFLGAKGDAKGKFVSAAKSLCLACKSAGIGNGNQAVMATFKVYTDGLSNGAMNGNDGMATTSSAAPVSESTSTATAAAPTSISPISAGGHSRSSSGASSHLSLGASIGGGGATSHHAGPINSRSLSVASVSSDGSNEGHLQVDQEDIAVLTHDVRGFKEALGKLRRIFHPEKEKLETMRVTAHERLGEVLRILRSILEKYPPIQSTELLMAAGTLIQQVKTHNYEDEKADPAEFFDAIDQLALAFSSRVSEYLMGDLDSSSHPVPKTKSCENLLSESDSRGFGKDKLESVTLTPQEVDYKLMRLNDGVDMALSKAKAWSKYAKDVMTYIEKRASLEAEHARNLTKLAQTMRPVLKEESFLPFQSIYCTALDQDLENSNHCVTTCTLLQGQKFIEPLSNRKIEHEKSRKQLKEIWHREVKRMHDAVNNLKKAEMMYHQRHQELDKAKESVIRAGSTEGNETAKLDKKKKLEEEAFQKAIEAETTYKSCIIEANQRQQELEKVKAEVLQQVRELIYQCDQTMKAVTVGYFQLQHTVSAPAPVQFQTLCESSRLYEPGTQYMEFVKRIPNSAIVQSHNGSSSYAYYFKPYCSENRLEKDRSSGSNESEEGMAHQLLEARLSSEGKTRTQPMRPWVHLQGSDSDSVSSYHSNKSQDTSPTASPRISPRRPVTMSSGDELETEDSGLGASRRQYISKAAETHTFRKLKTPSRCRECDSYVYFQGLECTECGLASHRKCLEALAIQCGHKPLPRKMNTFGVSLAAHAQEVGEELPDIVTRCVKEINERGLSLKGIYRVSGVKSRVEKLCQSFENGADLLDLSDVHPSIIANVLKLYLRQLPEPLLTFRLYNDFVKIAKDNPGDMERAIPDLQQLVKRLPQIHYKTLSFLMHHLKRVSENCEANHMPPSNLGIVFGPTLLRTSEGSASLSSLVDTVHQTRVIEILITLAYQVFGKPRKSDKASEMSKIVQTSQISQYSETKEFAKTSQESYSSRDVPSGRTEDSLPGSQNVKQPSEEWRGASIFTDDEVSEMLSRGESALRSDSLEHDAEEWERLLSDKPNECPVPPPRKNAHSNSTHSLLERDSESSNSFTSSFRVTLMGSEENQEHGEVKHLGVVKNVAELRRQFFESPPQVFKSDSLSQFVSSPSCTDIDYVPSSDSGSSIAAGSEGSSEAEVKPVYSTPISPRHALDYSSSRSTTVSDLSSSDLSCTASPLTSSISHLGLNSILRPFSTTLTSTPATGKHFSTKWQSSSTSQPEQEEDGRGVAKKAKEKSSEKNLYKSQVVLDPNTETETVVRRTKSVEYGDNTSVLESLADSGESLAIVSSDREERSKSVWKQSTRVSSVQMVREIARQSNNPLPTDEEKCVMETTFRNPEFV